MTNKLKAMLINRVQELADRGAYTYESVDEVIDEIQFHFNDVRETSCKDGIYITCFDVLCDYLHYTLSELRQAFIENDINLIDILADC